MIEEDDESKQFSSITLEDLVRVDTLGMGGFGRVELVGGPLLVDQEGLDLLPA